MLDAAKPRHQTEPHVWRRRDSPPWPWSGGPPPSKGSWSQEAFEKQLASPEQEMLARMKGARKP